jgi:hypothetical protein
MQLQVKNPAIPASFAIFASVITVLVLSLFNRIKSKTI